MLCILYVILIGSLLGAAAHLAESVLPDRAPRRWLWCAAIAASLVVPPVYRARHAVEIGGSGHAGHEAGPYTRGITAVDVFDPEWWAGTSAYDPAIERVWVGAQLLLLLLGVANAWRVWRILRRSRAERSADGATTVVDGVPVLVTDSLGPATVGVLRPRVVVPRWVLALPRAQRGYVLRHEDEHRRSRDALLLFVASLAVVILPWNLAAWWSLRRLQLAVEMDCDRRVVAALGDAPAYGALLLRIAEAASRGPRLQPAFLGAGSLERRLRALLGDAPGLARRVLLPAAAVALVVLVLLLPHPIPAR